MRGPTEVFFWARFGPFLTSASNIQHCKLVFRVLYKRGGGDTIYILYKETTKTDPQGSAFQDKCASCIERPFKSKSNQPQQLSTHAEQKNASRNAPKRISGPSRGLRMRAHINHAPSKQRDHVKRISDPLDAVVASYGRAPKEERGHAVGGSERLARQREGPPAGGGGWRIRKRRNPDVFLSASQAVTATSSVSAPFKPPPPSSRPSTSVRPPPSPPPSPPSGAAEQEERPKGGGTLNDARPREGARARVRAPLATAGKNYPLWAGGQDRGLGGRPLRLPLLLRLLTVQSQRVSPPLPSERASDRTPPIRVF